MSTTASATSINVTVTPPVDLARNGIITNYIVTFHSPSTSLKNESFTVLGLQGDIQVLKLSGLEEFQNYSIMISACNDAGCSLSTTNTSAMTLTAGKSLQVFCYFELLIAI